jgi:small-conductance mechanosensitive channel
VADRIPLALDEPKPLLNFTAFGDSAIELQLSAWTRLENVLELRNTLIIETKKALDQAGIEIPFPQRAVTMVQTINKAV